MTMKATGHLFYIPTNRQCDDALRNYLREADRLSHIQEAPVVFALIEANDEPFVREHDGLIESVAAQTGLRTVHLTVATQRVFITKLVKAAGFDGEDAEHILELLMPTGIAYGAGPNKAALLAAAMGANTLHRRDSDTEPMTYEGAPLYPCDVEARYSGSKVTDFPSEIGNVDKVITDSRIFFVASDYSGDLPVDRLELAELSLELMVEHERLEHPNATPEDLERGMRAYFLERNEFVYTGDKVEVDTIGATELGVSCVHRLFLDLPEMPIRETLGCDYFAKNLLYRLDWPVLYHNRRVLHIYPKGRDTRADARQYVQYNLMDARYKLLWRIWSRHNRNMEAHRADLLRVSNNSVINSMWYADSFDQAVRNTPREELQGIVESLASLYQHAFQLSGGVPKFLRLVEELNIRRDSLVAEVLSGIADYTMLIRFWPRLVAAAREVGFSA